MREILFRGKRCDGGGWVYGYYIRADHHWHKHGIHKDWIVCGASANGGWFALHNKYAVKAETVGQFTGLTDKNGKKIFEGDIVRDLTTYLCHKSYFERGYKGEEDYEKYRKEEKPNVVSFVSENFGSCGCCFDSFVGSGFASFDVDLTCCEVIGNIHDNPELLEDP